MYDYVKSLSDFPNGLDPSLEQLHGELATNHPSFRGISLYVQIVTIHFDTEPTQTIKDAVDTLVAAHTPS